jgi:hypothetical protein
VADEADDERDPTAPDRSGSTAPLLCLTAVLGLTAAALCLHAASGAAVYGAGPLRSSWLVIAFLVAVAGTTTARSYRVRQQERPMPTVREERIAAAVFAGVMALVVGTVLGLFISGDGDNGRLQPHPDATPTVKAPPLPHPTTASPSAGSAPGLVRPGLDLMPVLEIGVVVLLAVLVVVVLVWLARWLRGAARTPFVTSSAPAPKQDEERLADAISAGRLALQGDDTRAAVIACYAAMEASLADNGLGRHDADSPSDLLGRATSAGLLDGTAPETLADLFREARFSRHPMGRTHQDRARDALEEIDAHLAARRARADAEADAWAAGADVRPDEQEAVAP